VRAHVFPKMEIPISERKTMFNTKCLFVAAAVLVASFFGGSAANAQSPTCPYTVASLQGSYSVVVNYGANVALGLWAETLDGRGNLTRTGLLNQPTPGSTTGERTIGTVSSIGTYTVNCNGTGTMNRVVTLPNGSMALEADDFIITEAISSAWQAIATTIVDAQRVPSAVVPGGVFVTHVHTRLPQMNPQSN